MSRQGGHVRKVWMGSSSLAIKRYRNVARVLPKPGKLLEHQEGRDTSHVPRGRNVAPPRPGGLARSGESVGPGG